MINIFEKIWFLIVLCFSLKIYFPVFAFVCCLSSYMIFIETKSQIKNKMVELAIKKNGINDLIKVTEKLNDSVMIDEYRWSELNYPVKWNDISIKEILLTRPKIGIILIEPSLSFLIWFVLSLIWPISIPVILLGITIIFCLFILGTIFGKLFQK